MRLYPTAEDLLSLTGGTGHQAQHHPGHGGHPVPSGSSTAAATPTIALPMQDEGHLSEPPNKKKRNRKAGNSLYGAGAALKLTPETLSMIPFSRKLACCRMDAAGYAEELIA